MLQLGPAFWKPPSSQRERKQIVRIEGFGGEGCLINREKYLMGGYNKELITKT